MTGYGTAAGKVGQGRVTVEVKTINHRYCEINLKIPSRLGVLEKNLKTRLQSTLQRGKIEFFLKEVEPVFGGAELVLNIPLAKQYQRALSQLQKELKIPGPANPLAWTSLDHFIQTREREGNVAHYQNQLRVLLKKAMAQVEAMRAKEGKFLEKDQKKRLKEFFRYLTHIERINQTDLEKKKSESSFLPLGAEPLNSNFTKIDISEEITRLQSHAKQYQGLLSSSEPVGRKLDFLIQEMHREMNTIGAKVANAKISRYIVESKALLENLREQVQNIL